MLLKKIMLFGFEICSFLEKSIKYAPPGNPEAAQLDYMDRAFCLGWLCSECVGPMLYGTHQYTPLLSVKKDFTRKGMDGRVKGREREHSA